MKYFILYILGILILSSACAQDSRLLVRQTLIDDITHTPIYPRLTEEVDGKVVWKTSYRYIDSIELYGITYMSDGLKIRGLLAKPRKPGKYPCIIYNRGGNREFGALKIAHGVMRMGRLANEGYVVIASQYRGNGGSEGAEEFGGSDVNDVVILEKVLGEIPEADTDNIGMYGWSRGGMMTYIALTKMDNIKAVVVGGAVSDNYASILDRPEMETGVIAEIVPDYASNKEQALYERSAIKWVDRFPNNVPILLLHGNADWRVKPEQSLHLALEFEKFRIPYRLIMFEGGDHGISEHRVEVDQQIVNWFDKYLKKNESLPDMKYHGQ